MSWQMSMLLPTFHLHSRFRGEKGGGGVCPVLIMFLPIVMAALSSRKAGFNKNPAFLIIARLGFIW